jgi:hypothetical protein
VYVGFLVINIEVIEIIIDGLLATSSVSTEPSSSWGRCTMC